MRRRLLAAAAVLVLLVVGRGCARGLWLLTPGTLPDPTPQAATAGAPLTVLTLNVLCSFCTKTGYDGWSARLPELRSALARHDPDLAAIQELTRSSEIDALLGEGASLSSLSHPLWPDSVILYRTDRFTVLSSGQVWLSPTPTLPLSRAWRIGLPRLVQWAVLADGQTGGSLLFASTHLDGDRTNKDRSAALIGRTFPPLSGRLPVVFAGDLNTAAGDDRFAALTGGLLDSETIAEEVVQTGTVEDIPHTRRELRPSLRIDHILVSAGIAVRRFVHDAPTYGDPPRRPSDHPVIVADLFVGP